MRGGHRWLDRLLKHRFLVLGTALLLTLPALFFITQLEAEDTYDSRFSPDDLAYRFYKEVQRRFANDMFFVVVFRDEDLFSRGNLKLIAELTVRLEEALAPQRPSAASTPQQPQELPVGESLMPVIDKRNPMRFNPEESP